MSEAVTVPINGSSAIREVSFVPSGDGNFRNVTFLFVNGGGETHTFVVGEDLSAVLEASSVGTHYWRVFRKKYKTPLIVEAEPTENARP
jgi:hypothetical protein